MKNAKTAHLSDSEREKIFNSLTEDQFNVILDYLAAEGALQYCFGSDGSCSGGCPSGHYCQKLHNNNCICVRS